MIHLRARLIKWCVRAVVRIGGRLMELEVLFYLEI